MKKQTMIFVLALIIVGVLAFFGGLNYGQNNKVPVNNNSNLATVRAGRAGAGNTGGFISGEIISQDEQSVVVKLRDGGSKIIFITPTTPVTKTVSGSSADLKAGEQVMVTGASNADGSVSAQSVQIRPEMMNPTPVARS